MAISKLHVICDGARSARPALRSWQTGVVLVASAAILAILVLPAAASARNSVQSDIGPRRLDAPHAEPFDKFDRELFAPPQNLGHPGWEADSNMQSPSAAAQGDPLAEISRQMQAVESRIAGADSGSAVQDEQKRILDRLDAIIEQMQKSCSGGAPGGTCEKKTNAQAKQPPQGKKSGKGATPGEGAADAKVQDQHALGRRADMEQIRSIMKRLWGELPRRDRERLMQYPVEQFLPEYELMIEEYYKRLSEEDASRRP
jgi:hypothetical protein